MYALPVSILFDTKMNGCQKDDPNDLDRSDDRILLPSIELCFPPSFLLPLVLLFLPSHTPQSQCLSYSQVGVGDLLGKMASSSDGPPEAGPSTIRNPQLSQDPWFAFPTPTREQVEDELPPFFEGESVPLGLILDRLVRSRNEDLKSLVQQT
jgi:hypothetical protein